MATTGSTKVGFFYQGVLYCELVVSSHSSNCYQDDRFINCTEIVPLSVRSIVTGYCHGHHSNQAIAYKDFKGPRTDATRCPCCPCRRRRPAHISCHHCPSHRLRRRRHPRRCRP